MASSLIIRIGADLSALGAQLKKAEGQLKRFSFKAERIGRDLTTRVTLPIVAIGATAVKTFAEFDRLEKGLSALSGSAQGGAAAFNRLNAIVLDTRTTLDLKTAALGEQRLVGAGLAAAEAERTIKQLGIAATVSGSSIEDVGGVLRQFTQIIGKGKVEQEDLNSILDRMPAIGALLKQEFGGVTAEAIRETGISMEEFVGRTITAIEVNEDFQGVQGGLAKSFESFGNAVQVGIRPLGEAISKALNLEKNLERLGQFITRASQAFADLNPGIQKFVIFTALGAASIGPLTLGLGAAARAAPLLLSGLRLLSGPLASVGKVAGVAVSAFAQLGSGSIVQRVLGFLGVLLKQLSKLRFVFVALTSPIGLIVAAIALVTIAFVKAYKNSEFFRRQIYRLGEAFQPIIDAIKNLVTSIFPSLSGSFSGIGSAFNTVFSVIAAGISFLIEGFIAIVDTVTLVAGAVSDIFSGDFGAANEKLAKTLFNPAVIAETAVNAANAAVTTFQETVDGRPIEVKSFAVESPVDSPDTTTTGASGPARQGAVQAIAPGQIDGLNVLTLALQQVARDTEFVQSKIDALRPTIQEDIFEPYREGLEIITEKQNAFGDTYDSLSEKINLTKSTIASLIEEGYTVQSGAVELLIEQLAGLTTQQDAVTESITTMKEVMEQLSSVAGTAFGAVTQAMSKGASAAEAFGRAVVGAMRDAIAAQIKEAVTAQAASALKTVPFPFNVGLAAAAGAGASALFNSLLGALNIPLLADGGITQGAGLFVAGEAGPEAIIPLDRLSEFMQPSGGQVSGILRADGNELIAVIDTVNQQNSRSF